MKAFSLIIITAFLTVTYSCKTKHAYEWGHIPAFERSSQCGEWENRPSPQYDSAYTCEKLNSISFPCPEATYGKIVYNIAEPGDDFIHDGSYLPVDKNFIAELRTITSDSSCFRWGELGTQYRGCIMEFYDRNHKMVGLATLSWGGMLSCHPGTVASKWGLLSKKGSPLMFQLLKKYESLNKKISLYPVENGF